MVAKSIVCSGLMLERELENSEINFGVSLKKLKWELLEADEATVLHLSQKLDIDNIFARVLVNRGIMAYEEALSFIEPKLRNLLPDPFSLKDMDKAVARIQRAIEEKERIAIFGDYDVDGASSSALLKRFFAEIGIETEIYIPNRLSEGYGPNIEAFNKLQASGNKLIITVDCGTVSYKPLSHARKKGLDVIVIDHHLGGEELPEACAVVNPNRVDESFPHRDLAAVAVAFLVLVALRQSLRNSGWFSKNSVKEPDLMRLVDLVALGTVCDAMPLRGLNRAFVSTGLKLMARRQNHGILALSESAKIVSRLSCYHLGFVLGPRINAGGRVGHGSLGSALLSTPEPSLAQEIAQKLELLNEERKAIESLALEEALEQIESKGLAKNPMIIAYDKDWHPGILGILASRLKEIYSKPAAVVAITDGIGKGSARSIPGVDLGSHIALAKNNGLLIEGGGHAMAGGFSVEEAKLESFYSYLVDKLGALDTFQKSLKNAKTLRIDSIIKVGAINIELAKRIANGAPYGSGNPAPRFAILNARVVRVMVVGQNHIMLLVKDNIGRERSNRTLKCMLFRGLNTVIGDFLLKSNGNLINLVGTIQYNDYSRDKVDFIIEDVAFYE